MKIKFLIIIVLSLIAIISVADSQVDGLSKSVSESVNDSKIGVNYELTKYTLSSGGGVTSAGVYSVTSSIGQIDAGHNGSGGNFRFKGGLLAQPGSNLIFSNSFE